MSYVNRIRSALIDLELVTTAQWEAACAADNSSDWRTVLDRLRAAPAWWSPEHDPALSDYQYQHLLRGINQDKLDQLRDSLRLQDYLVLRELGHGGMGVVYKAWDLKHRRFVALKRMRDINDEVRARFRREANLLARLHHPNIAQLLDMLKTEEDILIMEYVDGETVDDHVRRRVRAHRALPWPVAIRWTSQVLDALEHAHSRRVIHRDIKPGNIMVPRTGDGPVKLLDMGLAKCTDPLSAPAGLTLAHQVLGTGLYMPPEQWKGGTEALPASDLYSLGGTLFYMLTGRPPFPHEAIGKLCLAHVHEPPPAVRQFRLDVPESLERLVGRMLAKAPAERGTARELRLQMQRILAGASAARVPAAQRPGAVTSRPSSSHRRPAPAAETARAACITQVGAPHASTSSLLCEIAAESLLAVWELFHAPQDRDRILTLPAQVRLKHLGTELWQHLAAKGRDYRARWRWRTLWAGLGLLGLGWLVWRVL